MNPTTAHVIAIVDDEWKRAAETKNDFARAVEANPNDEAAKKMYELALAVYFAVDGIRDRLDEAFEH